MQYFSNESFKNFNKIFIFITYILIDSQRNIYTLFTIIKNFRFSFLTDKINNEIYNDL